MPGGRGRGGCATAGAAGAAFPAVGLDRLDERVAELEKLLEESRRSAKWSSAEVR